MAILTKIPRATTIFNENFVIKATVILSKHQDVEVDLNPICLSRPA